MKTMRCDITINVRYCCCWVDEKYMYTVLYIYLDPSCFTSTLNRLISPVVFSPVCVYVCVCVRECVYTVCNTIVINQIIHNALGLNKPVLHLLWGCGEQALVNDRVPDGSQSFSQRTGCAIFTPSSLRLTNPGEQTVDSTCAISTRRRRKMSVSTGKRGANLKV